MSQPHGEPWIRAAVSDDHVVAELLLRLKGSYWEELQPSSTTAVKPLRWTTRQRRSRPPPRDSSEKPPQSLRHSPTTPLSCSAGTSQEYGSEEYSTRNQAHVGVAASEPARSKINENADDNAVSKKSRKRKSLAELKDMENSLVKERRKLKMEIDALRVVLEKKRAANESLKRTKNEIRPIPGNETASSPRDSSSCGKFVLPDLNMPLEEHENVRIHRSPNVAID